MPLSATVLALRIKAKMLAADPPVVAAGAALDAMASAIAEAVVEHITAAGVASFAPGAIAVTGTAVAQANPLPCVGVIT